MSCAFVGGGFSESLASASRCGSLGREAGFTGSLTMHVALGAAELPAPLLGGGQAVRELGLTRLPKTSEGGEFWP